MDWQLRSVCPFPDFSEVVTGGLPLFLVGCLALLRRVCSPDWHSLLSEGLREEVGDREGELPCFSGLEEWADTAVFSWESALD